MSNEITPISKARIALIHATTPEESKDVEAMAAATQAWAKEQNDFELAFEAACVYIEARINTTKLIAPSIKQGGDGSNQYMSKPDPNVKLADFGFTYKQWERRRAELQANPEFDEYHDECIEKGVLPTPYGLRSFHYKRDMRHGNVQTIYAPQGMDACQTPAYALDPLLPYLKEYWTIWEPAAGEGLMVDALLDSKLNVTSSDLITGNNFFEYEPDEWDCIVTNPPYSIKFKWLERCYQLGKPFALLMPLEALGTRTAQEMFEACGIEIILLNRRINFKMPEKGWEAGGATFPTVWYTWQLGLGSQLVFGKIKYE